MAQLVVYGVVTGAFLLLATLGFALVSRVEKFLNIAHAELIAVGAYMTWFLQQRLSLPFLVAAVLAVAATMLIGLIVGRLFYDPLTAQPPAILLITSVGVMFFIQGIIEAIISPGIRSFALPDMES